VRCRFLGLFTQWPRPALKRTFPTIRKIVDDIVYEVDCAMIIHKEGEVNIGGPLLRFPLRK